MRLYVDSKALKVTPYVQKDVNLEDILINHTKYFESEELALEEFYVPLDFCTSIRSTCSNHVLQERDTYGDNEYYTSLIYTQQNDVTIHRGYDLLMFLASSTLTQLTNYKIGFNDLMMKHSMFCPIGLYNPSPYMLDPIIYSHILFSDEGMRKLAQYLKEEVIISHISELEEEHNSIKALLDTLVEVKEVSHE